jgi:hypothetical protein
MAQPWPVQWMQGLPGDILIFGDVNQPSQHAVHVEHCLLLTRVLLTFFV